MFDAIEVRDSVKYSLLMTPHTTQAKHMPEEVLSISKQQQLVWL